MKLGKNKFKQGISEGKPMVGLWNSFTGNDAAEVVANAGFDWVTIDMEHSPNEMSSVFSILQVYAGSQTPPMVRPPWNDTVIVKKLLDIGAQSFLFPMIQSVAEAEAAVAATRYPPKGVRGVAGATRASKYGRVTDYFDRIHDEVCVIVQLETLAALDKAEEIAAVDGVDGVFFGPSDIAADMGYLGKPNTPEVWAKIHEVADKLKAANHNVGTLVLDANEGAKLLNNGFSFVAVGLDTILLARSSDKLLADVKSGLTG